MVSKVEKQSFGNIIVGSPKNTEGSIVEMQSNNSSESIPSTTSATKSTSKQSMEKATATRSSRRLNSNSSPRAALLNSGKSTNSKSDGLGKATKKLFQSPTKDKKTEAEISKNDDSLGDAQKEDGSEGDKCGSDFKAPLQEEQSDTRPDAISHTLDELECEEDLSADNLSPEDLGGGRDGSSGEQKSTGPAAFNLNKNEEFNFIPPPECPVFRPTEEEFKNPLSYISKVRPIAEKYGICKIHPPKSWTPPFTVDVDKLRFTPRVQRLNELEAKTRVKFNFFDQIAKFWELQGSSLKIPMVERKALDLYTLYHIVQEEGGMDYITRDRKWSKVACRMGYPAGKSVGTILKSHFERILHPFDVFTSGKTVDSKLETEVDDQDYKPHDIVSRQQIAPPNEAAGRSKRYSHPCHSSTTIDSKTDLEHIKEEIKQETETPKPQIASSSHESESATKVDALSGVLTERIGEDEADKNEVKTAEYRRLQIHGAGPKMSGYSAAKASRPGRRMGPGPIVDCGAAAGRKKLKEIDPLAKYICHICERGDAEEAMLLCDGCDDSYHTFCLIPPLNEIPKGDWRCPKCVVEEVSKPVEAFGFEQAEREYTLQQFGEMADQFKADYFSLPVHMVKTDLVEREFWRIVASIDEDVTVEYGADLHTMDHGSGFPTKSSLYLLPGDQKYAESSWNLNNLPLLPESVLAHINADISGMKVPWMYVGMCFATFCWHNEDHWSYSINYLHWGEPKTWYGVPGSHAEAFENTMKSAAPELFNSQPDLLHQLVTIMNPNILMNARVPVYRTDQQAGEFVVTFPRAYHTGFNQGYNFAEAVNFAPADWLKMGRECINHYSILRRFCVFSHDELVCNMALNPDKLSVDIATACYIDMAEMLDFEKTLRKSLLDWGVNRAEREAFELLADDERQCESCKTTCFLSAVTCSCTKSIVCLRHYTELCNCPPEKHTLKYRYTLDELPLMLKKLKMKAKAFENWLTKVRDALNPNTPASIPLEELQELVHEAEDKKFPSSLILDRLNSAVLEAEKCVTVIQHLDINKIRTRTRNSSESAKYKLTLTELEMFAQEIDNLCCIIQEGQSVRDLQNLGKEFVSEATAILSKPLNKVNEREVERLIEEGQSLCIELPLLKSLKDRKQHLNWYSRVRGFRDAKEKMSVADIQNFVKAGLSLTPDKFIEKELVELQEIILSVEDWEEVAQKCFQDVNQHELTEIELLLERGESIEGLLPSRGTLRVAIKKAKEWLATVEILHTNENYPYFHTLEGVVNRGRSIPFALEELTRIEKHLSSARDWKERTSRTFLKKLTQFNLMEVLSPRSEAVMLGSLQLQKSSADFLEQFTEDMKPVQIVNAFKNAEDKEIADMIELRMSNMEKNPEEDLYCLCKRKFQGIMYHCQLCKDWFHAVCVPPPKHTIRSRAQNATSPSNSPGAPQAKYLCPSCMRSRRPRLETILTLLVSLKRLPIRMPEGEALQCLTERAINWQDRVRNALAVEDVASALAALSQRCGAGSTPEFHHNIDKSQSFETSENKKDFSASEWSSTSQLTAPSEDEDEVNLTSTEHKKSRLQENPTKFSEGEAPSSPTQTKDTNSTPQLSKSNLPLINLCPTTKDHLESLMMEGDLLEVSLDETLHLWRILNAAKPSISELAYIHEKYKITPSSENLIASKKRRSEQLFTPSANKKVAKAESDTGENSQSNTPGGEPTTIKPKLKRGRKSKSAMANAVVKDGDNSSENVGGRSTPSSARKARETNWPTSKKRKRRDVSKKMKSAAGSEWTSDDDEECSAQECAKPSGREVDWVQCDGGCNMWFHMFCVGLDKHQIKADDDYFCNGCKEGTADTKTNEGSSTATAESETAHLSQADDHNIPSNISSTEPEFSKI